MPGQYRYYGGYGGGGAHGGGGYDRVDGSNGRYGGGGGSAGGGNGGTSDGATAGGAGGTSTTSPNGQAGADSIGGGGGGGGGGYDGNTSFGSMLVHNHSALRGGVGGAGGYGYKGGGGGGAGGYGAISFDAHGVQVAIQKSIIGGDGGDGGLATLIGGGGGGDGGVGVYVVGRGVAFTNTSVIQGGAGGAGGHCYDASGGTGGKGGAGFIGTSTTIRNTATIQGGAGGAGGTSDKQGAVYSGYGGRGGAGISGSYLSVTNSGMIRGGDGGGSSRAPGLAGAGVLSDQGGTINNQSGGTISGGKGASSIGVFGKNLTIVNNGTIAGGFAAIDLYGGTNTLTLGGTLSGAIGIFDAVLEFESSGTLSNTFRVGEGGGGVGRLAAAAGTAVTFSGMIVAGPKIVFGMAGESGSLIFANGCTLSGDPDIEGPYQARFVAGNVTFDAGAKIRVSLLDIDGASVTLAGSRGCGGTLRLDDGSLDLGANDLTSYNETDLSGGTVSGSGTFSVGGKTTLDAFTALTGKTTLVDGGVLKATAGLSLQTNADLIVAAKDTYDLDANASIGARTANDTITNRGLIEKTGGGRSIVTAALTNIGTTEASSGTLDLTNDVSGSGTLETRGASMLELGGIIAAAQTMKFGTGAGSLQLDHAGDFHATISGFGRDDAITLTGFSDMAKVLYTASTDTLSVSDGSRHFSTHLDGSYDARGFSLTHVKSGEAIHYSGA